MPYTDATLARVCRHIDQVQPTIGWQMLLEAVSTCLALAEDARTGIDSIAGVVILTGCGLLLDVNNVHVALAKHLWDPKRYFEHDRLVHVQELHLTGSLPTLVARDAEVPAWDMPAVEAQQAVAIMNAFQAEDFGAVVAISQNSRQRRALTRRTADAADQLPCDRVFPTMPTSLR